MRPLQVSHLENAVWDKAREWIVGFIAIMWRKGNMNIMAIGCNALDIDLYCGATLEKFAREEHQVHVMIIHGNYENSNCFPDLTEDEAKALFARYGIDQLHFISEFDYSAITQKNAELLNGYTSKIKPNLVIIPFWKSKDLGNRILSKTALIACRGIGSVLMYNNNVKDNNHYLYSPNVTFQIAVSTPYTYTTHGDATANLVNAEVTIQDSRNLSYQTSTEATDLRRQSLIPDKSANQGSIESFESHRLLLLEDEENEWL